MIIDAHSHWLPQEIIYNSHFFHKAWGDIETQLKMMDEMGLDKAVLSYPTSDAHLKLGGIKELSNIYNNNLARIFKRYPDRFIGACILPIDEPEEMLKELRRCLDLGFRAISLASSYDGRYLDEPMFLPIYKYAQENNLPIFVHSQIVNPIGAERVRDPLLTPVIEYVFDITICLGKLLMSGILADYQVNFIFAYFGGVALHLADRFDVTYKMLRQINFVKDLGGLPTDFLRNIYVDTSGDKEKTNFLSALNLLGADHILWGSDWPAKKEIRDSMAAVENLEISSVEKQGILGENLEKILKGV
ncbi:MAG: amidohydrolase family protein [Candidatus Omnitrophica bacterium]|nr:amidohydrolase family protein [Candidatus Omnitrophota bacterium]